ncbi:MAG: hypothetical protein WEC34_05830 [Acidimicrobiia bacterium]
MSRKYKGRCAFCQTYGQLTKEDPIPLWVNQVLKPYVGPGRQIISQRGKHRMHAVTHMHEKPVGSFSSMKVPVVCVTCNTGWMSRLQKAAKPILKPMILGSAVVLSETDQEVIAKWATMTALMFDKYEHHHSVTPAEMLHAFYETREVPPETRLWVAKRDLEEGSVVSHIRTIFAVTDTNDALSEDRPYSQVLTVSLGNLVVQIAVVVELGIGVPYSRDPAAQVFCSEVWPIERAVRWPPLITLTRQTFGDFANFPAFGTTFPGHDAPP